MAIVIQFTGCSGAGKTTIATGVAADLKIKGFEVLIVDGDDFRKKYAANLGFSYEDRLANISRMANFVNEQESNYDVILISAINPFKETRKIFATTCNATLVYVKCSLYTLRARDTKGLYHRAALLPSDQNYLPNLTGYNDRFDEPPKGTFTLDTEILTIELSIQKILYKISGHF